MALVAERIGSVMRLAEHDAEVENDGEIDLGTAGDSDGCTMSDYVAKVHSTDTGGKMETSKETWCIARLKNGDGVLVTQEDVDDYNDERTIAKHEASHAVAAWMLGELSSFMTG